MVSRKIMIAFSFLAAVCLSTPVLADLIDEEIEPTPTPKPVVKKKLAPISTPRPAPKVKAEKGEKVTTSVLAPKKKPTEKKGDTGTKPVHFTCKGLKGQRSSGRMELLEDVVVTQEDLRITSKTATIFFDEKTNDTTKVMAKGNVQINKIDEGTGEKIKAHANQAIFYNAERKIVLKGNARLWRGPDLVRGKQITYELDSGWIRASRVEGIVQPGEGK